jgi:hypothetical protein
VEAIRRGQKSRYSFHRDRKTKEVKTQRGRNSFISSRKTRYGKTKEVGIWRPRERTGEAKIQRPREKANSKRPKPRSKKLGTSFYLEIVGRPKYGGDERRPERPKHGGHKKRPERGRNRFGEFEISFGKTRYSVIPRQRGEKAKIKQPPQPH